MNKNKLNMDLQMFGKTEEPEVKEPEVDVPTEPKVPTPEEPNNDLAELQKKLDDALAYKVKYEEAQSFKTKYEETQESLKGHEQTLEKIAQAKVDQIPEEFRELVPEGTTQERLEWISKAEASGLFGKAEPKTIGSSSRTNEPKDSGVKPEEMTAMQKLTSGFKDFYTK